MPVFKGTKNFYDYELSDTLAYNLKSWLEYGLLEMGAYTIVGNNLPTSGLAVLKRVFDPRYGDNRVFEGMGVSWIWESGVYVNNTVLHNNNLYNLNEVSWEQTSNMDIVALYNLPLGFASNKPFQPSGVYVNNVFFPTSTTVGTYSHIIDYRNGRVIFNNAIPTTSGVKCEYAFPDIAVYLSDSPQWRTIVQNYTSKFDQLDKLSPSGMASILKENRVWLPCVIIDVERITLDPFQIGGGELASCEVAYHVFSDNNFVSRRIADLIGSQKAVTLSLFDINKSPFPYNYDGTLASGALEYPFLSAKNGPYFWTFGHIDESDGGPRSTITDVSRSEMTHTITVERTLSTY